MLYQVVFSPERLFEVQVLVVLVLQPLPLLPLQLPRLELCQFLLVDSLPLLELYHHLDQSTAKLVQLVLELLLEPQLVFLTLIRRALKLLKVGM